MGDLVNYPFLANVWGTVSDWLMVVITSITAYYLYKTLQSQKDVQLLQYEMMELEQRKFADTIRPIFGYDVFKREVKSTDNGLTTTEVVIRGINKSPFKAIKVKAAFLDPTVLLHYIQTQEIPHILPGRHFAVAFTMRADHTNLFDENNLVRIALKYTDTYKTTYIQKVEYLDATEDVIAQDPEIVKDLISSINL